MPEQDKSDAESFDLDRIKQLIRLMEKHDLTEVKLEGGGSKVGPAAWAARAGAGCSSRLCRSAYACGLSASRVAKHTQQSSHE